ncbi:MAG: SDR family NAD(P)-dependent oxidoreductase [Actinomycetes bacterium]
MTTTDKGPGAEDGRRVAVVTGAGRGIGRALVRLLSADGYLVVATDVDADGLDETASAAGATVETVRHEVRDPDAHREVARLAAARGPLTLWVNNAGVLCPGGALGQDDVALERVVEVNLLGVMYGSRAAVEVMRGHGGPGDVVNLGSMSAFGPVPGLAAYAATKAAVVSWTTSLAYELRGTRVRVHALCPDGVGTPMLHESVDNPATSLVYTAPRILGPDEVARAAVGLVGSHRLVRTLPRRRGVLARTSGLAPRVLGVALPVLRRRGDRRRRREADTARVTRP